MHRSSAALLCVLVVSLTVLQAAAHVAKHGHMKKRDAADPLGLGQLQEQLTSAYQPLVNAANQIQSEQINTLSQIASAAEGLTQQAAQQATAVEQEIGDLASETVNTAVQAVEGGEKVAAGVVEAESEAVSQALSQSSPAA